MKTFKRILLVCLSIAIIIGLGVKSLTKIQEQRIMGMINNGNIRIDQEIHEWNVCHNDSPVKFVIFIRNTGRYKISGRLVFSGILSVKGLEERFLKELLSCYGEEPKEDLKERVAKKSNSRAEATYNYLLRGNKLERGYDYEPVKSAKEDKDYEFTFREKISVQPGEIVKIDHYEDIPFNRRGEILNLKIKTIEF